MARLCHVMWASPVDLRRVNRIGWRWRCLLEDTVLEMPCESAWDTSQSRRLRVSRNADLHHATILFQTALTSWAASRTRRGSEHSIVTTTGFSTFRFRIGSDYLGRLSSKTKQHSNRAERLKNFMTVLEMVYRDVLEHHMKLKEKPYYFDSSNLGPLLQDYNLFPRKVSTLVLFK